MAYFIQADDVYSAWFDLIDYLYHHGEVRSPRGMETREDLGVSILVRDATKNIIDHPIRNLNMQFMVAEWLWILSGSDDLETIAKYNSQLRQFSDDEKILAGAYGPRVVQQLGWLMDKLLEEDTRQGVVSIWTPAPRKSKDIPCTLTLQFLNRDGKLHCIANMRSSDAWLGFPYDFFCFSQIQNGIAGELGLQIGGLLFNLGSSHLYKNNLVDVERILDENSKGCFLSSPRLPYGPPGSLLRSLREPIVPVNLTPGRFWSKYLAVLAGTRKEARDVLKTWS